MDAIKTIPKSNKVKSDKLVLLKQYLSNPQAVGALIPASKYLAKAISQVTDKIVKKEIVPIVELGAGTGALTKYLLHHNPEIVEIDKALCQVVKQKFPNAKLINACAAEYLQKINNRRGYIISIPLINNPAKEKILMALKTLYDQGLISWCIIYTYGTKSPLRDVGFKTEELYKSILMNIPPAHIWVYS